MKSDSCKPPTRFQTNGSTRIYHDRLTTAFKLKEDLAFLLQPNDATYDAQRDLIAPPISAHNENALQMAFYRFLQRTFTDQSHSIRNIQHIFRHTEAEVHQIPRIGTRTWHQIYQSLTENEQPIDQEAKIRDLEDERRKLTLMTTYSDHGHTGSMDLLRRIMDIDLDLHNLQQPSKYLELAQKFVNNMRGYQSVLIDNLHLEKCSTNCASDFVRDVVNTQPPQQGNIEANWNAYYTNILGHWKNFKTENDKYLQTLSSITGPLPIQGRTPPSQQRSPIYPVLNQDPQSAYPDHSVFYTHGVPTVPQDGPDKELQHHTKQDHLENGPIPKRNPNQNEFVYDNRGFLIYNDSHKNRGQHVFCSHCMRASPGMKFLWQGNQHFPAARPLVEMANDIRSRFSDTNVCWLNNKEHAKFKKAYRTNFVDYMMHKHPPPHKLTATEIENLFVEQNR